MLQVDDESTSVLMEQMYHHLIDGRTTVAQALRLAMLHLLRGPVTGPSPHWRRPVFWAGFLVVGATTRLRCTAPSAHPPQVMFRGWEYDRLRLALPALLAWTLALSRPLYLSLCVRACVRACVRVCVRVCVSKARCH